jgi:hypothetical protein
MSTKKQSSYESVLAVVLLLLLVHFFFPQPYLIPVIIGLVFLALLSRPLADALHWIWQKLTVSIGWVMSKLLLSIVFFVFLSPLALLYRLFRKKKSTQAESNFIDRGHLYLSDDLANPW